MASADTTVVSRRTSPAPSVRTSPAAALARRSFRDARSRTVAFAYIFALYSWLQAAGYHHTYPTLADRLAFARGLRRQRRHPPILRLPLSRGHHRRVQRLAGRRDTRHRRRRVRGPRHSAGPSRRGRRRPGRNRPGRNHRPPRRLHLRDGGHRGRHRHPVAGRVRRVCPRRADGRRRRLPGPGHLFGHPGLCWHRRRDQPGRTHEAHGPRSRQRHGGRVLASAGALRHDDRRRLASLGHPLGLGRGAPPLRPRPTGRLAPLRRYHPCPPLHRGPGGRHPRRRHRPATRRRHGRAVHVRSCPRRPLRPCVASAASWPCGH